MLAEIIPLLSAAYRCPPEEAINSTFLEFLSISKRVQVYSARSPLNVFPFEINFCFPVSRQGLIDLANGQLVLQIQKRRESTAIPFLSSKIPIDHTDGKEQDVCIILAESPDIAITRFIISGMEQYSARNVNSDAGYLNTKYNRNNRNRHGIVQSATIIRVFTLVHYAMTGVIINARCISRLESRKGARANFPSQNTSTHSRARSRVPGTTGFEAGAYQRVYTLQRPRMTIYA